MNPMPVTPGTAAWFGWPYEGWYPSCPVVGCVEIDGTAWEHEDAALSTIRNHVVQAHPELLVRRAELKRRLQLESKRSRKSHVLDLVKQAVSGCDYTMAHAVLDVFEELRTNVPSAYVAPDAEFSGGAA